MTLYAGEMYEKAYRPNHPLAYKNGLVYVHRAVLYDAIGPCAHACHWCKVVVTWPVLTADHLDGDRTNNARGNLVPACRLCNTGRQQVETFDPSRCRAGHLWPADPVRDVRGRRFCRPCRNDLRRQRRAEGRWR